MNTMVALPIAGAAIASPSIAAQQQDQDSELIQLSEQITELRKRYVAAREVSRSCEAIYENTKPEKPKSLLWRVGDPVGHSREPMHKEAGKHYLWCCDRDLRKLAGKEFKQWVFLGTAADWKKLGLECVEDANGMPPVKGHEHLFQSYPDKHRTKRATELLAAFEEYESKSAAAFTASGVEPAQAIEDELMAQMDEIYARMAELEASSAEGLRAQAIGFVVHCRGGSIIAAEYEEDVLLNRLLSSLSGLPIQAAGAEAA